MFPISLVFQRKNATFENKLCHKSHEENVRKRNMYFLNGLLHTISLFLSSFSFFCLTHNKHTLSLSHTRVQIHLTLFLFCHLTHFFIHYFFLLLSNFEFLRHYSKHCGYLKCLRFRFLDYLVSFLFEKNNEEKCC